MTFKDYFKTDLSEAVQNKAEEKKDVKIKDKVTVFEPVKGSGLLLSSGQGVNGEETKFK